jgi:hypothetical protein
MNIFGTNFLGFRKLRLRGYHTSYPRNTVLWSISSPLNSPLDMCNRLILLVVLVLVSQTLVASIMAPPRVTAVSVFKPEESDLHKYSAVLAATEPIRLRCEVEIKRGLNPFTYLLYKLRGVNFKDPSGIVRIENKAVDAACTRYENRVDEVVRSYGLTPEVFNGMSQRIKDEPFLKRRVLLQAYFYRIAADLETNTKTTMPTMPTNGGTTLRGPVGDAGVSNKYRYLLYGASRFERFCHALYAVECERLRQREQLQDKLGITSLPVRMCDPDMLPAMCSDVRGACAAFPSVVNQVTSDCGVPLKDFYSLNNRWKRNPVFRFRVQREIESIDRRERRSKMRGGSGGASGRR